MIGHRVSEMPKVLEDLNTQPAGGWRDVEFSWSELVHAAITVGRESWAHVFWFGRASSLEVVFRISLLRSSVGPGGPSSTRWVASPVYGGLAAGRGVMDASEKAAVSYFLGSSLACAFARRTLGVRWILHQSIYGQRFARGPLIASSRRRPDFIAFDAARGLWCQLETKGRSSSLTPKVRSSLLSSAKLQASAPLRFGGVGATVRLASILDLDGANLRVDWQDPDESRHAEVVELEVSPASLALEYYRALSALLPADTQRLVLGGKEFAVIDLPEVDISWGVDAGLIDAARDGASVSLLEYAAPDAVDTGFVGADGVWVRLGESWGNPDDSEVR
jgi:hypothetical protein